MVTRSLTTTIAGVEVGLYQDQTAMVEQYYNDMWEYEKLLVRLCRAQVNWLQQMKMLAASIILVICWPIVSNKNVQCMIETLGIMIAILLTAVRSHSYAQFRQKRSRHIRMATKLWSSLTFRGGSATTGRVCFGHPLAWAWQHRQCHGNTQSVTGILHWEVVLS